MSRSRHINVFRRPLTIAAALTGTALTPVAARAQDATWNGPGTDYHDPANWSPIAVPANRAIFAATGPAAVDIHGATTIDEIRFDTAAHGYTLTNDGTLTINGNGYNAIVNLSSTMQTVNNLGTVVLNNESRLLGGSGGLTINNGPAGGGGTALLAFNDHATADNALIVNTTGSTVRFDDFATGASAHIVNNGGLVEFLGYTELDHGLIENNGGVVHFYGLSSPESGRIVNSGTVEIYGGNAGDSTIVNQAGGLLRFSGSSGGTATITNLEGGNIVFSSFGGLGGATLFNAGTVTFFTTVGGGGRVTNAATGIIDLTGATFSAGMEFDSLSGSGLVRLGPNPLIIFTNGVSIFGGIISGPGGLDKQGVGTLILTGANTYTGGGYVVSGALEIDGSIRSRPIVSRGAFLTGTGTINSDVINDGFIAPGNPAAPTGTLTVTGNVDFRDGSFLYPILGPDAAASLLDAGSITITGGVVWVREVHGASFPMQADYLIARGANGISGRFQGFSPGPLPGFLDAGLVYTATEIFIRVRRTATNFAATAGLTPNQAALSARLDNAVSAANPLVFSTYLTTYNALVAAPNAAALQQDLDTLSGDALTVLPIAAQRAADRFGERLESLHLEQQLEPVGADRSCRSGRQQRRQRTRLRCQRPRIPARLRHQPRRQYPARAFGGHDQRRDPRRRPCRCGQSRYLEHRPPAASRFRHVLCGGPAHLQLARYRQCPRAAARRHRHRGLQRP